MYRILIVDDEAVEREAVRFLLHQYKFQLDIYEAVNGEEALEEIQKIKFDILFTDIRMPFIDGIELAKRAKALYHDIYIIFFSGYDDFTYVKEALSLRVVDYILKPIECEEFQKTIMTVLEYLQVREKTIKDQKVTQDFMRNHIVYQLINKTSLQQLEKIYPQSYLTFANSCHCMFLIQLERDYFGTESGGEEAFWNFDKLQHILPEDSCLVNLNPSQNVLLCAGQKHSLPWYQKLANELVIEMKNAYQMNCFVAVSSLFSKAEDIPKAYEETERKMMERFFFSGDQIYEKESAMSLAGNIQPETNDVLLKQINMDIQFKDAVSLRKHIRLFLDNCRIKKNLSYIFFRYLCTSVLQLLLDGLSRNSEESFDKYAKIIYQSNHMAEIEFILLSLTEELAVMIEKKLDSPKYVLEQVKQYIHNHYREDLSLPVLAQEVYLTPRYLSALFIEENGYGISRYIKKVRMEKAQELLLNTNMKINDVCHQVGYSNLSYFCKSFAEEFGTTPNGFRRGY